MRISTQIRIADGKLSSVSQGVVSGITDTSRLADFGLNPDGSLWLNLYPDASASGTDVLNAATTFIEAAHLQAEATNMQP